MVMDTAPSHYKNTALTILRRLSQPVPELALNPAQDALKQTSRLNQAMKAMVKLGPALPSQAISGGAARACHVLANYQLHIGNDVLAASLAAVAEYMYAQEAAPTESGSAQAGRMATFL